jgi:F-type H+-transporting ATPase subunit delta
VKASSAVAKSYAKAVFALARERNQADEVQAELERAAGLMSHDGDAVDVLGRPWISPVIRKRLADELGARMELSRLGRDFLVLLATHRRVDHLAAIAAAYREMLDAARGRVRARVRTAVPLTDADRTALAQRLGRALGGKSVVIEEVVDTHLLGGFVAEIGSLVVDGSLDGQLARIRERLVKG